MFDDYDYGFDGDFDALAEEIEFAREEGDEEYANHLSRIYRNAMRFELCDDYGYDY